MFSWVHGMENLVNLKMMNWSNEKKNESDVMLAGMLKITSSLAGFLLSWKTLIALSECLQFDIFLKMSLGSCSLTL